MNQDFHYYATYLAAIEAGYTTKESEKIAYAAQLVDDCTVHNFSKHVPFPQIATSRSIQDIATDMLNPRVYTEQDVQAAKEIWSYFHFLPGNLKDQIAYNGRLCGDNWDFNIDKFRLMCLPESELSQEMIQNTITQDNTSPWFIHLVGLRMHVLADTWAHAYFGGIPDWSLNDVHQSCGLSEWDQGRWWDIQIGTLDFPQTHTYIIPELPSPYYISPCYLGHGQLGKIPDYGYIHYQYIPVWKEMLPCDRRTIDKDNSQSFLNAFRQMVIAMKAIRTGEKYPQNIPQNSLDTQLETAILSVLRTRNIDQSKEWKALIDLRTGSTPQEYKLNRWRDDCDQSPEMEKTDYCYFCKAAQIHKEMMKNKLEKSHSDTDNFVGVAGQNSYAIPELANYPLQVTHKLTINGEIDLSKIVRFNNCGCVYNISLAYSPGIYNYVITVDAQGPQGLFAGSGYLKFTDESRDVYTLSIFSSSRSVHTVRYNSQKPNIIKVAWSNTP